MRQMLIVVSMCLILLNSGSVSPALDLADNFLLITDIPTGRVIRVRNLTEAGWEQGPTIPGLSLARPIHFSLDSAGRIYLTDQGVPVPGQDNINPHIVRMDDIAGNGWKTFSGVGSNILALPGLSMNSAAYSTALDAAGRIYIVSSGRLVRIDDMDGTGWVTFTPPGSGLKDAILDQSGRIYISDNTNHRIVRFNDMQGSGFVSFGSYGNGVGQFNEPEGVALDSTGRIYITDNYNHRIVRINDMTGAGWTTFGSYGSSVGQFNGAHDIKLDSLDRIYVADTGNQRIARINSMTGAGWVSFGFSGCSSCTPPVDGRFLLEAPKGLQLIGTGPVLTYTSIFPQVAVGGGYRTSIMAINSGTANIDASVALTKRSSTQPGGVPFAVIVGGEVNSTFTRTVAPMGMIRLDATSIDNVTTGYARLRSANELSGTALFQTLNGDTITSEAGVGLSGPVDHFTIYVDNLNGAQSGYAVANPYPDWAPEAVRNMKGWSQLTMTLRDKNGNVLEIKTVNIAPDEHLAEFVSQRFPATAPTGFEGSLDVSTRNAGGPGNKIQAVALRYDNPTSDVFTTIPVITNVEDAAKDLASTGHKTIPRVETRTLYYPQVADGGSYRTNFIFVNTTDTPTSATLQFFGDNGTPLSLPINGVDQTSQTLQLTARGVARLVTDGTSNGIKVGWARVTSAIPIGGSAIFQTTNGGRITSEAGVSASSLASHFITSVESLGSAQSGIGIANPNASNVNLTFNLRNSLGQIVASTVRPLAASGHTAFFFTQLFPTAFDEFEGTLEVLTSGSSITAVALRYDNPNANVFATAPVIVIQ
jgi:hypothetical protein